MLNSEAWTNDQLHGRKCAFARIASDLTARPLNRKNQTSTALSRVQSAHNCDSGTVWLSNNLG